jgi:hypothetical protein
MHDPRTRAVLDVIGAERERVAATAAYFAPKERDPDAPVDLKQGRRGGDPHRAPAMNVFDNMRELHGGAQEEAR